MQDLCRLDMRDIAEFLRSTGNAGGPQPRNLLGLHGDPWQHETRALPSRPTALSQWP
jgi:hypothetical protein